MVRTIEFEAEEGLTREEYREKFSEAIAEHEDTDEEVELVVDIQNVSLDWVAGFIDAIRESSGVKAESLTVGITDIED